MNSTWVIMQFLIIISNYNNLIYGMTDITFKLGVDRLNVIRLSISNIENLYIAGPCCYCEEIIQRCEIEIQYNIIYK